MRVHADGQDRARQAFPTPGLEAESPWQPPDIVIYTMGWDTDGAPEDGKPPTAQLRCRVTLDGKEVDGALAATVETSSDFTRVTIVLNPASVSVVSLHPGQFGGPLPPDDRPDA